MATPPRLTLLSPLRVSIATAVGLAILVGTLCAIALQSLDRQTERLLAAEVETLLRSQSGRLNRGDIRGALEALGTSFRDLRVEAHGGATDLDLGQRHSREVCYRTALVAGEFNGDLLFCRPAAFPTAMLAASALAYLLLATILVMAVYSLERTARRTIARLLLESGVELDGEMTLAHMRANISSIVASLDEARQKERSLATEAAIGRMAQLLAHDVRKPITLVRAGVAALARQSDPAQVLQKAGALADRMETVTRSVEGLIEDVLEAGRPTRIAAEPASVRALVETALAELAIVAPGPALRTTVTFGHHNKGVFDTAKVGRVLTNIIDNAVAAAGAAGRIWIRTEECEPAGALRIIVGNSGSFIAEQDRLKVFDSFYTSGKRNGTGLGLAIARKIIEAHGGRIWCVSSESPGDAPETEFVFELPPKSGSPDEAPIQSRITAQSPVAATPGPKDAVAVVVLDDDPFVREDWASHLEDVAVAEFARPEDFLAALDQTPDKFVGVKAVVTDYYFDQTSALTGIDLAARLAGKLVGAAILLASDVVRDGLDLPPGVQAIPKTPLRAPELWRRIGYA